MTCTIGYIGSTDIAGSFYASYSQQKEWDFFISHASEDKNDVARPLSNMLSSNHFRVWYDEFSLKLGDSLRRSIDHGLSHSKYGVVIFSPNFFAKEWPQSELDGLFAREIAEREKIILPVWHNINYEEVAKYSPLLADRFAARTVKGLEDVVNTIMQSLPRHEDTFPDTEGNSLPDNVNWVRVGTLFWLCHDLIELHRWLLVGISKEWIDIGFRQSLHHSKELGLDSGITNKLQNLKDEAEKIDETDWNLQRREQYAYEVKIVFNVVGQLTQQRQQTIDKFDPGPG